MEVIEEKIIYPKSENKARDRLEKEKNGTLGGEGEEEGRDQGMTP